jgi:hypothetical protein
VATTTTATATVVVTCRAAADPIAGAGQVRPLPGTAPEPGRVQCFGAVRLGFALDSGTGVRSIAVDVVLAEVA